MAIIKKKFTNFYGIDLKSSDIIRSEDSASDLLNVLIRRDRSLTKRFGHKFKASSVGGLGMFVYNHQDQDTGLFDTQILTVDKSLYKLLEASITISYSGTASSCVLFNVFDSDTNTYHVKIQEDMNFVLDFDCGNGFDEFPINDLSDLAYSINALSGFTASVSGDSTVPAAFLDICSFHSLKSASKTLTAIYPQKIYSPITYPFANGFARINEPDYTNYSFAQANNVVYIANGYDDLMKYDGQSVYRAGMPKLEAPVLTDTSGTTLTGRYEYQLVATYWDASGNLIEGNPSEPVEITVSAKDITLTIKNIPASSGFNTNCAIVDGDQNNVTTINVDSGHTMQIGDTAYFFDNTTGVQRYVEKKVINRSNTSITVDSAVSVLDNSVVSANLRIGIYRTEAITSPYQTKYLVAEIPNNSLASTQVYVDSLIDSELINGIELVSPLKLRDLPPKGRYINFFYNQLCMCGNPDRPSEAYYSDVQSPEYFPPDNMLILQSKEANPLTGCIQNNELFIFTEARAIHVIAGDMANDNFRVETIAHSIGCVSHHTMQEIEGELYFVSERGFYKMTSGSLPINIGTQIDTVFDKGTLLYDLNFSRAIAINHQKHKHYIIFVPSEDSESGKLYATNNSLCFVYDYLNNAWLKWQGLNFAGGVVFNDDVLLFTERNFSQYSSDLSFKVAKELNTLSRHDYIDHNKAINFEYKTSWYHEGEPTVFKKYLRFKIFALKKTNANSYNLNISIEKNFCRDISVGETSIDIGLADGYGISPYGVGSYGDVSINQRIVKIGPLKAQSIRFILSNNELLSNVDITGWEIELETSYVSEMKQ